MEANEPEDPTAAMRTFVKAHMPRWMLETGLHETIFEAGSVTNTVFEIGRAWGRLEKENERP